MRGRDASSNSLRAEHLKTYKEVAEKGRADLEEALCHQFGFSLEEASKLYAKSVATFETTLKHRGFLLWNSLCRFYQSICIGQIVVGADGQLYKQEGAIERGEISYEEFEAGPLGRDRFEARCQPVFQSYKSTSGQVFDSLVFKSPSWIWLGQEEFGAACSDYQKFLSNSQTKRNIAATMAHRTMRQNKTGIYRNV